MNNYPDEDHAPRTPPASPSHECRSLALSSPDVPLSWSELPAAGLHSISRIPSSEPRTPTQSRPTIYTLPESSPVSSPTSARPAADEPLVLSEGFVLSSPIRTSGDARRKAWAARQASRQKQQEDAEAEAKRTAHEVHEEVLRRLAEAGLSFGSLVEYVSDPANYKGAERYNGFFSDKGRLEKVLNAWVSSRNSKTGRARVRSWALEYIKGLVSAEGDAATRSKLLQTRTMEIDTKFSDGFSITSFRTQLLALCPTAMEILHAFSTTSRQDKEMTELSKKRKETCVTTQALVALGSRSQNNSYAKHVIGLYAYASGAQRQTINVLSSLGLTCSYTSLIGRSKAVNLDEMAGKTVGLEPEKAMHTALGLLRRLSHACRLTARDAARLRLLAYVYDNINMLFRIAEQVLGRKDSQQNGTCATAFELYNASEKDMQTKDLVDSLVSAPPLALGDILLSAEEEAALSERLTHTVLRIIVTYGGEKFARFHRDVLRITPVTADKIPLHQTEIYPLPAMNIDESSTSGNSDVLNEIFREVGQDITSPEFTRTVRITAGDQLSISRIRSLIANRAGHDSFGHSFLWALCMPGLFHYKMAATHGLLDLHFGSNSARDPGSLAFHNTVLDRKPVVLSSLPPFRTCRDLIFVSAYARVLHCLTLVADCDDLGDYAAKVDFPELREHARAIVEKYANAQVAYKVRRAREAEQRRRQADLDDIDSEGTTPSPLPGQGGGDLMADSESKHTSGDVVFENAVLCLRDSLLLREFTDAIKVGDSGRVVTILKLWALSFRGSGRTKYAYETMHLIHNLTHVWPAPLRRIVLQNWLVNPTGKAEAWVEVDLMQEHLNFWTKTIYKAHGSGASWEWLSMISPCIGILRRIATQINSDLGGRQGSKHTSPDLEKDIHELMRSLSEHRVYCIEPGRVIDGAEGIVPNAITAGWRALAGPLSDFNSQLKRLQKRCLTLPVIGLPYTTVSAPSDSTVAHPGQTCLPVTSLAPTPQVAAVTTAQSHLQPLSTALPLPLAEASAPSPISADSPLLPAPGYPPVMPPSQLPGLASPSSLPHKAPHGQMQSMPVPEGEQDHAQDQDEDEDEDEYWASVGAWTYDDDKIFSLDTAEDVALDMDLIDE
ncbi:hypothetical protein OH77DRAFT_1457194 [Trametes cingulata]|nr:hypothetical protein OH77DRAFT_1457194 [Trametes cingulata]